MDICSIDDSCGNLPEYINLNSIKYYTQTGEIISDVSGYNEMWDRYTIETHHRDNKRTELYYSFGNQDYIMSFAYNDFSVLRKLIPEYDYNFVISNTSSRNNKMTNIQNRLEDLQTLMDNNLITYEEYESKRKSILEAM